MPKTILHIDSSVRIDGSASRYLSQHIVSHLAIGDPNVQIIRRDTNKAACFIDGDWADASFTSNDDRNTKMNETLKLSDGMVAELVSASHIVIGAPLYNFSIPTTLRAWVDHIARPGLSFLAKNDGFEGLLKNKQVYLAIVSGSTEIGGEMDYATPYLKQVLSFFGITEVSVFSASNLMTKNRENVLERTIANIDAAFRSDAGNWD